MTSLATIGTAELKTMSVREFTVGLEEMPADAIARFSRMRKLRPEHVEALDKFLKANPDKRVQADGSVISSGKKNAPGGKAKIKKTKKAAAAKKKKVVKKKPVAPKKPAAKRQQSPVDGYVPLILRLEAWWKGIDVEVVRSAAKAKQSKVAVKTRSSVVEVSSGEKDPLYRLEVAQRLWGQELNLPGGMPYTAAMLKPVGLKPGMSFLDLSAGIGGPARMLAKKFELDMTALEADEELAMLAQELSAQSETSESVPVAHFQPETLTLEPTRYDVALSRENLFAVDDKKRFLDQIAQALKPDGTFVFTDFTLTDRNREPKALVDWREAEPVAPRPWTFDEYRQNLTDLKFDVRLFDDATDEYLSLIHTGWKKLMSSLEDNNVESAMVDALMAEASIWHARYEALDSGRLKVLRVQANMRHGPVRSLTDAMRI